MSNSTRQEDDPNPPEHYDNTDCMDEYERLRKKMLNETTALDCEERKLLESLIAQCISDMEDDDLIQWAFDLGAVKPY